MGIRDARPNHESEGGPATPDGLATRNPRGVAPRPPICGLSILLAPPPPRPARHPPAMSERSPLLGGFAVDASRADPSNVGIIVVPLWCRPLEYAPDSGGRRPLDNRPPSIGGGTPAKRLGVSDSRPIPSPFIRQDRRGPIWRRWKWYVFGTPKDEPDA